MSAPTATCAAADRASLAAAGASSPSILYDVAIGPLANEIRKSTIKGIPIPKTDRGLKVSLFADDYKS